MATELPLELIQWLYKVLLNEYHDPKKTYQDVCLILINFSTLRPRTRIYTDEYGRSKLLLNVYGTLKVAHIRLPIDIWFPFEYPQAAPIFYVLSNEDFVIKPTNHVRQDGLVFHPFLYSWSTIDEDTRGRSFKILSLINLLVETFNKDLPCIFRPQRTQSPPVPPPPPLPPVQPQQQQHKSPASPPQLPPKPRNSTPQYAAPTTHTPERIMSPSARSTPVSPPVYKELEQLSLMDQDNSANVPKLPPNPTRLEALNNLNANLASISQSEIEAHVMGDILSILNHSQKDVAFLQNEILKIEQDQKYIENNLNLNNRILDDKIVQVTNLNQDLHSQPETDLDELIIAPTLQHQQLYQLVTKDKAITDTINVLGKLYEAEKIQLTQMMKFIRSQAREQYLCRALIKKIVLKLGLHVDDE